MALLSENLQNISHLEENFDFDFFFLSTSLYYNHLPGDIISREGAIVWWFVDGMLIIKH